MSTERKMCKECPWKGTGPHSVSWPRYVETIFAGGHLSSRMHICHMLSKDTWGDATPENFCVGSAEAVCKNTKHAHSIEI